MTTLEGVNPQMIANLSAKGRLQGLKYRCNI